MLFKTLKQVIHKYNFWKNNRIILVKGKGNYINVKNNAVLNNCRFDIVGNNNLIQIEELVRLKNVTFFIRGDNNRIMLGNQVKFKAGGLIWMEDYNCEIAVGDRTTFEDAHLAVTGHSQKYNRK